MAGQIHTLLTSSSDEIVSVFDNLTSDETLHNLFISRLPQRRLVEYLDITDIECYWLTDRPGDGTIPPSYNELDTLISNRLSNHKGSIVLEGLEWLSSLHGFEALMGFIRSLSDSVHRTYWDIFLSVDESSFNSIEFNLITREAPIFKFVIEDDVEPSDVVSKDPSELLIAENLDVELHEDGSPKLVFLTRLPQSGFTKSLLQRRILQWRRMGLDVSEVESALHSPSTEAMYQSYSVIEEKVRRAIYLDNWIAENVTDTQERSIAQFRIRQLTGLDELEQRYIAD
tara:strand:- start:388 stop:1242 length:855 start_codon:yes stop_codon:yes gene_type:complete